MQVEQVETSLASMPAVSATASCVVEGETSVEVYEGDIVTCRAHVTLTRPSHRTSGATAVAQPDHAIAQLTALASAAHHLLDPSRSCSLTFGLPCSHMPCQLTTILSTEAVDTHLSVQ